MKKYISVKVQPRARRRAIERVGDTEYKLSVLSPPAQGKANEEVVELVASHFGLPPSKVKIIRGERSRHKLILIGE